MPGVSLDDFFEIENDLGSDIANSFRPKPPTNGNNYSFLEDLESWRNSTGLPMISNRKTRLDNISQEQMMSEITGLYRDGEYLADIANTMNERYALEGKRALTGENIRDVIRARVDYWRKAGMWSIDEKMAYALARNDQMEMIAWEAFLHSREGRTTRFYEKKYQLLKSASNKNPKRDSKFNARADIDEDVKSLIKPIEDDPARLGQIPEMLEEVQKEIEQIQLGEVKEYTRVEECKDGDPRWIIIMQNCQKERNKLWGLYTKEKENNPDEAFARLSNDERLKRVSAIIQDAKTRREGYMSALAPASPLGGFPEVKKEEEVIVSQDKGGLGISLEDLEGDE